MAHELATGFVSVYCSHMNKTNKLIRSVDDMFLTSPDPSPVMQAAMESIKRQMATETAYRERVRAGLEPANQWGNWAISDRH